MKNIEIERVSGLCAICILRRNQDKEKNKKLVVCPFKKCIYSDNKLDKIRIELETNRFNIKWRDNVEY